MYKFSESLSSGDDNDRDKDLQKDKYKDHTWYLSFFYIHTFSVMKILHSEIYDKFAPRQNN